MHYNLAWGAAVVAAPFATFDTPGPPSNAARDGL
jgi:hypothetical protein